MKTKLAIAAAWLTIPIGAGLWTFMQPDAAYGQQSSSERSDTFVQSRENDQENRRAAIRGRGADGRLTAMRAIVRAHFRARPRSDMRITNADQLPAQDQEDVAILLTMLGYEPASLQGQSDQARILVSAATDVLLGSSTIQQQIALAPEAYVVKVDGVRTADVSDGYRTIARLTVSQVIKGDLIPGATLQIKQRTGPAGNGEGIFIPGEFLDGQDGEFLVFPSRDVYRFRANARTTPAPEFAALYLSSYRVVSGSVFAIIPTQRSNNIPLSSLR